jgi:ATP-dependent RNA helicase DDX55/SPB4
MEAERDVVPVAEEYKVSVPQIQTVLKTDRDLIDKSVKGFVSFIRSYNEHELCYLFQLKDLDVGEVANTFGLFYFPKMKELRTRDIHSFQGAGPDFDIHSVPYIDKNKGKQKLAAREE